MRTYSACITPTWITQGEKSSEMQKLLHALPSLPIHTILKNLS
jgi:hypothetical protein